MPSNSTTRRPSCLGSLKKPPSNSQANRSTPFQPSSRCQFPSSRTRTPLVPSPWIPCAGSTPASSPRAVPNAAWSGRIGAILASNRATVRGALFSIPTSVTSAHSSKNPRPVAHKFGGTSLASAERIRHVADLLAARDDPAQAIVVSAMRGVTDALIAAGELAAARDPG
ncbi:MAG: hypothetical protein KDE27_14925, partial [Planctomycetes bacterium]|nr:hypothetical protein [Planctomycetota bacterium]